MTVTVRGRRARGATSTEYRNVNVEYNLQTPTRLELHTGRSLTHAAEFDVTHSSFNSRKRGRVSHIHIPLEPAVAHTGAGTSHVRTHTHW